MSAPPAGAARRAADRARVEAALEAALLPAATAPARLHEAMRYAVLAGGKRLRPLLTLAACRACGGDDEDALPAAAAVELIHTYSLVHDDLPAMDDDRLRRGQPTVHVAYGEALAILVGDALLNRAFELLLADGAGRLAPEARLEVAATLAAAAGSTGMIGGQVLDLAAEGQSLTLAALEGLHRRKTGALLTAAVVAGGLAAEAGARERDALRRCGDALGLAFQIVDDILDVTGTPEQLGKSAGKDQRSGKATFPALLGLDASRARAARLVEEALEALVPLGAAADDLRDRVRMAGVRER